MIWYNIHIYTQMTKLLCPSTSPAWVQWSIPISLNWFLSHDFFFNCSFSSCKCWELPRSLTTWHFMPWHSIASASFAVCFMDGPSLRVIGTRSGTGASRHSFGLPSKDRALDLKRVGWVSSEDSKWIMSLCESNVNQRVKELKKLGLSQGDVVLLRFGGRQTVAACEGGGREGGVLLSNSCRQSLAAEDGDEVQFISHFEAKEAQEVLVETSSIFVSAWSSMATGLELHKYLKAVLDGTLLFQGDVRQLSLNGQVSEIQISSIHGKGPKTGPWPGPWLVTEKTGVKVKSSKKINENPEGGQITTGFAQVGGLAAVIEELKEAVQLPLQNPQVYRRIGVTPPRGVLLYGPPGTGKTLLAKSLAEELECPCELLAATDLVGTGLGESEERIKMAFQSCRQQAAERKTGALLFIDEVDAVCPKRDDASEMERRTLLGFHSCFVFNFCFSDHQMKVLNMRAFLCIFGFRWPTTTEYRMVAAFLTALDGVHSGDSVVLLGATNRPDAIDPALRRAGRLEREIEVGVPNAEELIGQSVFSFHLLIFFCCLKLATFLWETQHELIGMSFWGENDITSHQHLILKKGGITNPQRRDWRFWVFTCVVYITVLVRLNSASLPEGVMDMWGQTCDPCVRLLLVLPCVWGRRW